MLEVRLGGADRVAALADEMQSLVDEFSLAHGHTAGQWFRGWAEARKGRPQEGHRLIREAYDHNTRLGMRAGASEVLGYAAEALLLAGDVGRRAKRSSRRRCRSPTSWARACTCRNCCCCRPRSRAPKDGPRRASASVRRAVEEAREQQAPWLELIALVELCAHHDASTAERQALAELVDQLPEAAGTEPVVRARSLLQAAKPA